jgi:hypothetical protein
MKRERKKQDEYVTICGANIIICNKFGTLFVLVIFVEPCYNM